MSAHIEKRTLHTSNRNRKIVLSIDCINNSKNKEVDE